MKRWTLTTVMLVMTLLLAGCSSRKAEPVTATNLASDAALEEVCTALREAGAENVDLFQAWAADFNESAGEGAGLTGDWADPASMHWDPAACQEGWEAGHEYSDADCRMTAFLLTGGLIDSDKVDEVYQGTYLMFDVDAIENVPRYEGLRADLSRFTTLFGERSLEGEPESVFSGFWKEYGFQMNSQKLSLLNVVLHDRDFGVSFVGHTGVLVDCGDHVLFVEKLAFQQPFQVTRAANVDQILDLLAQRPEYFGTEAADGPYLYRNGEFLKRLEKAEWVSGRRVCQGGHNHFFQKNAILTIPNGSVSLHPE